MKTIEDVKNKIYSEHDMYLDINFASRHAKKGNLVKQINGKFYDKALLDAGVEKENALISDIYEYALRLNSELKMFME